MKSAPGFIRKNLASLHQHIAQAPQRIYQNHHRLPAQRKWLERLAKQLVHEVIIDHDFVNHCFADDGGAKRLDKVLNNQLDTLLDAINDALWEQNNPQQRV